MAKIRLKQRGWKRGDVDGKRIGKGGQIGPVTHLIESPKRGWSIHTDLGGIRVTAGKMGPCPQQGEV